MKQFLLTLTLLFTAVGMVACASTPTPPPAPKVTMQQNVPKELYQKVLPALYEVIVPRPDEAGVTYERPLPTDRLS